MTYFGFLLRFLVIPILILIALHWRDRRRGSTRPASLRSIPPALALGLLVVTAIVYTTPWDNYLVATGVWWYEPALVTGVTLGWVPLEEYVFFVLQTVMAGLWLLFVSRRARVSTPFVARSGLRVWLIAGTALGWLASAFLLFSGWKSGNYLALELVWALPPIILQLAVGADILWHYRRLVALVIIPATLYLSAMDVLAISSGVWTISPEHTLGVLLPGGLPLEEAVFFLLTNTLLTFGLVLALARETAERLPSSLEWVLARNRQTRRDKGYTNG